MTTHVLDITLKFTEPTLGTTPGNRNLVREFKAPKAPTAAAAEEEINVAEEMENSATVFPRDATGLFAWNYQLRGFFKEAIYSLIELGECPLSKWGYKKAVDLFLHVSPRRVHFLDAAGKPYQVGRLIEGPVWNGPGFLQQPDAEPHVPGAPLQRPLRATTMQGDRVALACSESLPIGTQMKFRVQAQTAVGKKKTSAIIDADLVRACLDRGRFVGFSQWRGAGWGQFTWEEKEV